MQKIDVHFVKDAPSWVGGQELSLATTYHINDGEQSFAEACDHIHRDMAQPAKLAGYYAIQLTLLDADDRATDTAWVTVG